VSLILNCTNRSDKMLIRSSLSTNSTQYVYTCSGQAHCLEFTEYVEYNCTILGPPLQAVVGQAHCLEVTEYVEYNCTLYFRQDEPVDKGLPVRLMPDKLIALSSQSMLSTTVHFCLGKTNLGTRAYP
jgi:hypothetical protein